MTREIDNALLIRRPEIPPTIDSDLLPQEHQAQCASCAALEEHNANQAREIDSLKLEVRELRDRLQGGFTNERRTEATSNRAGKSVG